MSVNIISKATTKINAPASAVWQALTTPAMIRQYLFGSEVESEWKVGQPITWRGNYEGVSYEDKGTILQMLPEKLLQHTYHSSMSGIEDKLENYLNVTYELDEEDGQTLVTVTNSNLPEENSRRHSEENWQRVLSALKDVVERQKEIVSQH